MVATSRCEVRTTGQGDVRDISAEVAAAVARSGLSSGVVTVAVVGSTASITTIEHEPGAVADLGTALERLAPRDGKYRHHERWGDDNGSSHVRAAILGPSVTLPFTDGQVSSSSNNVSIHVPMTSTRGGTCREPLINTGRFR